MDAKHARFMSHVDVKGPDDCWLWTAARDRNGYGLFGVGSHTDGTRGKILAHRYSHQYFKGPIEDLVICHTCDNPSCVNPNHLFSGTYRDNTLDMMAKGRAHAIWNHFRKLSRQDHLDIFNSPEKSKVLAKLYKVHYTQINWIRRKIRNEYEDGTLY